MVSDQQTGRSNQIVKFPLLITNEGNIRDTFRLQACDPGDQTGCGSPMWQSSFSDSDGNSITQLALDPGQSTQIYLDVLVEGEEDADSARVLARVAIFGTSESSEHTVTVVVSNYNYGMAVSPQSPGDFGLILPGLPVRWIGPEVSWSGDQTGCGNHHFPLMVFITQLALDGSDNT